MHQVSKKIGKFGNNQNIKYHFKKCIKYNRKPDLFCSTNRIKVEYPHGGSMHPHCKTVCVEEAHWLVLKNC